MVCEALVVARGQRGIHGACSLALPGFAEHLVEHAEVQGIDLVVFVADIFGQANIFGAQQLGELARDDHVQPAHLGECRTQAHRNYLVGEAVPGQLGDVLAQVAHPLQGCRNAQGANDNAQVTRDRLLTGHDFDGQLIEVDGELVDLVVVGDHGLGEGHIRLIESRGRVLDRDGNQASDFDQALLNF